MVAGNQLQSRKTKSCGCWRIERGVQHGRVVNLRHGEGSNGRETVEYRTWVSMIQRCTNEDHAQWDDYGGRGITVCDRWRHSYEAFLADMGRRPGGPREYSINRKDNDKGYEPGNCEWTNAFAQNRNTRRSHTITIKGQTATLAEWLELTGISRRNYHYRRRAGLSDEEAILTPAVKGRRLVHD